MADMGEIVQAVVIEAMKRADEASGLRQNDGAALAALLRAVPLRRQYKPDGIQHKTIQAWARGEGMPDGDALLAVAKTTGISIDEFLNRESIQERMERFERDAVEKQRQLDELRHQLTDMQAAG